MGLLSGLTGTVLLSGPNGIVEWTYWDRAVEWTEWDCGDALSECAVCPCVITRRRLPMCRASDSSDTRHRGGGAASGS